jgi:hypothetical protein
MKRRKNIYLLGGASYVSNLLMSPSSVNETAITMNQGLINNFKKKVISDVTAARNPDLTTIKRNTAESRIQAVNNSIFPRDEDLISATHLVQAFSSEINRSVGVRSLIFLNGTDTAWITGLVRQTIQEQYGK